MNLRCFTIFFAIFGLAMAILPQIQGETAFVLRHRIFQSSSSPFSVALEFLQKQINYTFQNVGLLRRAMTHSSFSEENNRALSMLGVNVIESYAALQYLQKDIDISTKDLGLRLTEISKVETSCAVDGVRLGLQKIVRVSPKTNSSTPSVVCGAFRAIIGAIAVDTGKSDDAGSIFWAIHGAKSGRALAL